MSIPPHDHLMWAINGIYGGQEDDVYYRRTPDRIIESGGQRVGTAQSAMLGAGAWGIESSARLVMTGR